MLYVESLFRTIPENRHTFSNSLSDINLLPTTGSAMVMMWSETPRTVTQWLDINPTLTSANVMPAFLSSVIESK